MENHILTDLRGARFFCTENGRRGGLRYAFSEGCLLGLHLHLPRALAARAPLATLASDAGKRLQIPLSLVRVQGGVEEYAALFDSARLPHGEHLLFLTLSLDSPHGRLFADLGAGEYISLSPTQCPPRPLLLSGNGRGEQRGGVCMLPYPLLEKTGRLSRGADGDYDRFFSHLSAHGVRTLLLTLPEWDPEICKRGLSLPAAAVAAAEEQGVCCLFDLFPFLSLHSAAQAPERGERTPALCDAAGAVQGMQDGASGALSPDCLCGENGPISQALAGGYGGVFLRYADRFGDPLLGMLRAALAGHGDGIPFFACAACDEVDGIAFGRRRRFFDGPLDGLVSYTLRDALLVYLLLGDTEPLSRYLCRTLAAMPHPSRFQAVHPLHGDGGESFFSLLREGCGTPTDETQLCALAELGELIAATLPGAPVLPCEEDASRLAFRLRLFGMYRREGALATGDFRLHTLTKDLFVFSRAREGEMLLTVINRSPDLLTISSREGFSVLFGGRGRKLLFRLAPYSGTVLRVSLYTGEEGTLRLLRQPILTRDTRFTPRALSAQEKTS